MCGDSFTYITCQIHSSTLLFKILTLQIWEKLNKSEVYISLSPIPSPTGKKKKSTKNVVEHKIRGYIFWHCTLHLHILGLSEVHHAYFWTYCI